jgi:hypothetical protein
MWYCNRIISGQESSAIYKTMSRNAANSVERYSYRSRISFVTSRVMDIRTVVDLSYMIGGQHKGDDKTSLP